MIYELSFEGHTVGYFPTEAEAVRRAGVPPERQVHDPRMGKGRRCFDVSPTNKQGI